MSDTAIKVQEIFQDVFDDSDLVITRETSGPDIEEWDSLNNINLIIRMEKEFALKFNIADILKLENVGGMIDLIDKGLAEKNE